MKNPPDSQTLRQRYQAAGQGQVFRFWEELDADARNRLLARTLAIDLEEVARLNRELLRKQTSGEDFSGLEPAPYLALPEHGGDAAAWAHARAVGEAALRAGRVAAFTVAGGQGTRLGYDGPKGAYPVTPVSGKSLFQVFAEKIARSGEHYGVEIPWLILTSEINDAPTRDFFREHHYFGLRPEQVSFIIQGLVPAVDRDGRILLEEKGAPVMTPDGHGGSLRALVRSGATAKLRAGGVDCVSYFQVDNPLVLCVDPELIGFHLLHRSELSSKMIPKAYPLEKVGHFCRRDGKTLVIEYSDLPEALQRETLADGSLRFVAGSVAIHVFDLPFIERIGVGSEARLPFHRADKKIPHLDAAGRRVNPEAPNGVKFEMFVFDALPLAANPVIIEGERSENFSPVKNAEGADSPRSCREDQLRMFARWLREAGTDIETDAKGVPLVSFEISPRFAADRADFLARRPPGGYPQPPEGGVIG